jgi:TetR/AcrR family transcriptional regulator, cholesterol catabolism regulator
LQQADQLFNQYGIRSVTMDDMARNLGISKKTIYQYFVDKDEVIMEVAKATFDGQRCEWENVMAIARDAIDELFYAARHIEKSFRSMNPNMLHDLKKYHPAAWDIYLQHKESLFYGQVVDNLRRGIAQGLYRKEINVEVIARLRLEQIQLGFDPYVFPLGRYNLADIQMQLFDHFVHGIVTLKGYSLLLQYRKELQAEAVRL